MANNIIRVRESTYSTNLHIQAPVYMCNLTVQENIFRLVLSHYNNLVNQGKIKVYPEMINREVSTVAYFLSEEK